MEDFREIGRWFSKLAEDCATDGRYDVVVAVPLITFTGAVGSPVNSPALT